MSDDREITLTWGEIKNTDNRIKELEKNLNACEYSPIWRKSIENQITELRNDFYSHASLIVELKERVEGLYKTVHGITPDQADNLQNQIDKLAKYILEYFPGSIINEGACLTAIGIMEELRNQND